MIHVTLLNQFKIIGFSIVIISQTYIEISLNYVRNYIALILTSNLSASKNIFSLQAVKSKRLLIYVNHYILVYVKRFQSVRL